MLMDLQDLFMVEEVIPNLISYTMNNLLTLIPYVQEIKVVVYNLNKDGAPGPDSFGPYLY